MRNAVVLGASRGIGFEFARQLLRQGYNVYATARKKEDLRKLTNLGARGLELDVTNSVSVAGLSCQLDDMKFDLAVYVSGVYGPESGSQYVPSMNDFDQVMHTNVWGAMQLIPLISPLLTNSQGKFIFISSLMGSIAQTQSSFGWVYRASKAALNMTIKAAAADYPKTIFAVMNPGWVKTDMGGSQATLEVNESVSGMLQVINKLTLKDSGTFQSYDGRAMNW